MGKYIYGIIPRLRSGQVNSNEELLFVLNGERIHAISHQDISAVISDAEIIDYTQLPKDAVARFLIKHQQVIEKVMENFTIIPMRLGTFACDEGEVKHILAKAYPVGKDILHKIHDRIEIDVAVTWSDLNAVLKEMSEEKEIKEFKERLLANPSAINADDQMKVGVMVKKALDRKREKCAQEIQHALKTVGEDFRAHELMDDRMVTNFAFLINKHKQRDFDSCVKELNTGFNEKLNFRCVGPLPPYSFYTLEIKKMDFKEVDWARKKIGLNNIATKGEIKSARQTKALSSHPDRNPGVPGIEGEFDEVTKAHKVLLDYCQACEQSGQKSSYSFNEEEFKKNALLVKTGK